MSEQLGNGLSLKEVENSQAIDCWQTVQTVADLALGLESTQRQAFQIE